MTNTIKEYKKFKIKLFKVIKISFPYPKQLSKIIKSYAIT